MFNRWIEDGLLEVLGDEKTLYGLAAQLERAVGGTQLAFELGDTAVAGHAADPHGDRPP